MIVKLPYKTLADKVSDLYYQSIDILKLLTKDAHDRIDDHCGRSTSETASLVSWCWLEARKAELFAECGWDCDEFQEAEDSETRLFYENLEKSRTHTCSFIEFLHDVGDEDDQTL